MLRSYTIDLDGQCNQKCLFCMKSDHIRKGKKITYEMVVSEIRKAKKQGYKIIDFFGGEPTTYVFFINAAKLTKDLGMKVGLATNAIKFSSKKYTDTFFKSVGVKNIGCFRISLHGTEKIHNALVQKPDAYINVIKGMKNIIAYTNQFSVNIVITSLNCKFLSETVEILNKIGIRAIKFSSLNKSGRLLENQWLLPAQEQMEINLKKAIEKSEQLNFKHVEIINLPNFWSKYKRKYKNLKYDEIA